MDSITSVYICYLLLYIFFQRFQVWWILFIFARILTVVLSVLTLGYVCMYDTCSLVLYSINVTII